jgi:ABC-type dipeptide/oligopeptide/nickel transport system permease subunit
LSRPTLFNRLKRRPQFWLGGVLVLGLIGAGIFSGVLAPHDPNQQFLDFRELPPFSPDFPLGTDHLGRCLLSRLLHGATTSLTVGLCAVLLAGLVGVPAGAMAGFLGGRTDRVISRLVDVVLAFPSLLLAVSIAGVLGRSMGTLVVAVGVVAVPGFVRQTRASVLALKQSEFVLAARSLGSPPWRILTREILPNCLSPLMVLFTLGIATSILDAAGLSFLGLGAEPGTPEWGEMLSTGRTLMLRMHWAVTLPGLAIMLSVLGFNLLGDALRDALDPRGRR